MTAVSPMTVAVAVAVVHPRLLPTPAASVLPVYSVFPPPLMGAMMTAHRAGPSRDDGRGEDDEKGEDHENRCRPHHH